MGGRTVGNEEEDAGRDASVHCALEEFRLVEQQVKMAGCEELGVLEAVDVIDVLVEDAQCQDGQRRVEEIVHRDEHRIKHSLSAATILGSNQRESNREKKTIIRRTKGFQPHRSLIHRHKDLFFLAMENHPSALLVGWTKTG